MKDLQQLADMLADLGSRICDRIHRTLREQTIEQRTRVHREGADDTIYSIDKEVEDWLLPYLAEKAAPFGGFVLIAEGLTQDGSPVILPKGHPPSEAAFCLIIDPIDGTRGLMYNKRSAFFLAGAAPNGTPAPRLQDLEVAVMVELPTAKGIFSDTLTCVKGRGVRSWRRQLETDARIPLEVQPSSAPSIRGGFAQVSRFFPTAKALLAGIEEEMIRRLFPEAVDGGQAILFDDQYISSGGQLYEMLMGHDRFVADLRGTVFNQLGIDNGLTCHPYDLCAHLIGREAGLIITNPLGDPLDAPLDTTSPVDWVAYANDSIRREVEPVLRAILREKGFLPVKQEATGQAPGRLDVMGGVADYSGSLLLQMPLQEKTSVSIRRRKDDRFYLASDAEDTQPVEVPLSAFYETEKRQLRPRAAFRQTIRQQTGAEWPLYILGCFYELIHSGRLSPQGADIRVSSQVPLGKGVSSSAALEVATLRAISKLYGISFSGLQLPILAQQVENHIVGAPCGLMDQLTSYFGRPHHLLPIRCQPAAVYEPIPLPPELHLMGIDSGIQHAVSGDPYTDARVAAFMGYTMLAHRAGATLSDLRRARSEGHWTHLPYQGYLSNIDYHHFRKKLLDKLPDILDGDSFLQEYGLLIDPVTEVIPEKTYRVRAATLHPVAENHRIMKFKKLMEEWPTQKNCRDRLIELGGLMLQAHRSYSDIGLGSSRTDDLVAFLMEKGYKQGIYGARITGGGSGGTVCVLGYETIGRQTILAAAKEFGHRHQYDPVVFRN